ncbi:MAG: type I-D CRISPR-associated helicase Cas3' [Caldilineaceae bacterium]|nr:type I-D CRISPR-associated helicase Cas3' [Caldilineaceae bacterium]
MQIYTLPVYSKLAESVPLELAEKLPKTWQLSQHQVETYQALINLQGPDVIFNTAMTGDGKSLAGQLGALVSTRPYTLFGMYPTNELIRDQLRQTEATWTQWQKEPFIRSVDSHVIDQQMDGDNFRQRGEALLNILGSSDLILTNPDIFHYIMQLFYRRGGNQADATDKIFGPLVDQFDQFTFDEFHIFETPQVISVMNAVLLILEMTKGQKRRFLFQSATPGGLMLKYLERAGIRFQVVQGKYQHAQINPDPIAWRPILGGSEIAFSSDMMEEWIEKHLNDILLPFFIQNTPNAKGAIIVNSVALAKRLVARLKPIFQRHNLTVGENTGLTSRSQRMDSYQTDLLIGTSTVDVGVDFRINFLLFESRDAGSFLQRLGRLGRHEGYERDGCEISFKKQFNAYALLPAWIIARLFEPNGQAPPLLEDGMETDREQLTSAIESAFPPTAEFEHYARYWGGLQSARVWVGLKQYLVRGAYADLRQRLGDQYNVTFNIDIDKQVGTLKRLAETQKSLAEEAIAFRGGSYFTCGILDMTEVGAERIKTYDLFSLLANANLGPLSVEEYQQAVTDAGLAWKPFERQNPVAFFRLFGFRDERTHVKVKLQRDLLLWGADRLGVASVVKGITIDADGIPGLNRINRSLQRLEFPALICLGVENHPLEIKRRLRLPMLFPIHEFESRDRVVGSIAFGRSALLLDVALKHRNVDTGGSAIYC